MNTIKIKTPKGMMNHSVTIDGHLIADTNNSAKWKSFKKKLPEGKWSIFKVVNNMVTLIKKDCYVI
jgi:hypothetical protein